jgi:hypothetical protein
MGVSQTSQHTSSDLNSLRWRHSAALFQHGVEPVAFNELHDNVRLQVNTSRVREGLFTEVIDSHDPRMLHSGGGLGFAPEPGDRIRIPGHVGAQQLDRHDPLQAPVTGLENLTHTASPEGHRQLVALGDHPPGC